MKEANWSEDEEMENRRLEEHHAFTAPYREPEDWVKKVVIIGAGAFGREAAMIGKRIEVTRRDIKIIGFLDDNKELWGKTINGVKVLGGLDYFEDKKKPYYVCAVGDPTLKEQVVMRISIYNYIPINLIDPDVDIFTGVKLGKGIIIQKGVCLAVNCEIGDHVHINFNCSIGHNTILMNYCTISPMCATSGHTFVGARCFFGTGAITTPGVSIISGCTIGAGCTVVKDLDWIGTYIGTPAKLIKRG